MSRYPDPATATVDVERQLVEEMAAFESKAAELPDRLAEMAGVDVGSTPHEVVYEENKLELLHYEPLADETHDVPLLLVYALINRPYILDLQPDKSVVRRFLEAGFDVYLVRWNEPSTLDRHLTLDHYVNVYVDNCVDEVRARSGADAVNLLGYCMGGTMSAMYAALHAEKVRNLGLLATGLYFDDSAGVVRVLREVPTGHPAGKARLEARVGERGRTRGRRRRRRLRLRRPVGRAADATGERPEEGGARRVDEPTALHGTGSRAEGIAVVTVTAGR